MRRSTGPHPLVRAVALALVALLAGAPSEALAHVPTLESPADSDAEGSAARLYPDAQPLAAPNESRAVYGYLAPDQELDTYRFELDEPFADTVELLVPARSDMREFRPVLSFVDTRTRERIDVPAIDEERFFEPFSLATFRRVGRADVELPPGPYVAVVRSGPGDQQSGSYVIAFSGAERFSASDSLRTLTVLPSIWTGAWGGAPVRPAAWVCCGSVLLLILLAAALFVRRRRLGGQAAVTDE